MAPRENQAEAAAGGAEAETTGRSRDEQVERSLQHRSCQCREPKHLAGEGDDEAGQESMLKATMVDWQREVGFWWEDATRCWTSIAAA